MFANQLRIKCSINMCQKLGRLIKNTWAAWKPVNLYNNAVAIGKLDTLGIFYLNHTQGERKYTNI